LRGKAELIGKTIRCPRCSETFVFGYQIREEVTDTAVVRMLGDAPPPPPSPGASRQPATRPCARCGVAISVKVSVCEHCQCFVGHLPDYLAGMDDSEVSRN
jgi:hypothetical protein